MIAPTATGRESGVARDQGHATSAAGCASITA